MRIPAATVGCALLLATAAQAQSRSQLYANPEVPPQASLDRLNLRLAWRTVLPMDGRRDNIFSMQMLGSQMIVALRSGAIVSLDASSGALQWRTHVGTPYLPPAGIGANANTIFVAKGVRLTALDRATGSYQWEVALQAAPTAAPVADNQQMFVPAGTDKLFAYLLPQAQEALPAPVAERRQEVLPEPTSGMPGQGSSAGRALGSALGFGGQAVRAISAVTSGGQRVRSIGPLSSVRQAVEGITTGPEPLFHWVYETDTRPEARLEQSSLLTDSFVFQAAANGLFFTLAKAAPRLVFRFQADAPVSAPLGQYENIAYIASEDFRVYAIEMTTGQIVWRFIGGGPIRQKPYVTEDSLYVHAERSGLYRLDRNTGAMAWRNVAARRFLAVNRKFVYAVDEAGALLILDRATGVELARYLGTRDFVVPFSNELTDRIYLASNDGLLVCLHDRDYPRPLLVGHISELAPPPAPAGAGTRKPAADEGDTNANPAAGKPLVPKAKPKPKPKDEGDMSDK